MSTSPSMGMPIPDVGVTSGPQYATDIDSCLTIIDGHNHTSGSGVQIPVSGLNINTDFPLNNNNLITARSLRMTSQSAVLSSSTDVGCLSVVLGNLYYNYAAATQVQITNGGSIVGAAGTISGLPSGTASVTYSAGTYTFLAATTTPGNIDAGNVVLRNPISGGTTYGVTLAAPTLGSNSTITLPALPGSGSAFVRMASTGVQGATVEIDNSTLAISTNLLIVKSAGITATQLASNAVTTPKIADGNVTSAKMDTNITLTGTLAAAQVTAAGAGVIVTNSSVGSGNIALVTVSFNSSGGGVNGQGATCSHNSVGNYTVTFSSGFGQTPVAVVTPSSVACTAYISSISTAAVTVIFTTPNYIGQTNDLIDTGFNIILAGVR